MSNVIPFENRVKRVGKGESRLVYIAGPYNQREEAKRLKDLLEAAGHVTTSTWVTAHNDAYSALSPDEMGIEANHDAEGVGRAEIVVMLNHLGPSTSGCMHIEYGLGVAWGKKFLIVGQPTNIFHHLPNIKFVERIEDVPDRLNRFFPRPVAGGQPNGQ